MLGPAKHPWALGRPAEEVWVEIRDVCGALAEKVFRHGDASFVDAQCPLHARVLADEARRRRPDLKVLFTTGYTRNAIVHNGVLDPGVHLIGKPFNLEQLARKLAELKDA